MTNLQESDIQKISDTQIQYTIYENYNTLRKEATVILRLLPFSVGKFPQLHADVLR